VSVRNVVRVLAAVVFAGMMSASMVHAKACPAICKLEIRTCRQGCTTKPKAKCKRQCKKNIVKVCKDSGKLSCQVGSPSGAFLEIAVD